MVFSYYHRLTPRQRKIYDRSNRIETLPLDPGAIPHEAVTNLRNALAIESRPAVEAAAQALAQLLNDAFGSPPVRVRVLERRPSNSHGELHGLYEADQVRARPLITLWMRTVQRRQVVAFKTFLRTLLHEIVHHLDYEVLKLEDSLHTEGFYKRESSLLHQLMGEEIGAGDSPSKSRRRSREEGAGASPAK
jgi:hypothetical protein